MKWIRRLLSSVCLVFASGFSLILLCASKGHLISPESCGYLGLVTLSLPLAATVCGILAITMVCLKQWKSLSVLLAGLVLSWPQIWSFMPLNLKSSSASEEPIRVLTYNVRGGEHQTPGKGEIAEYIISRDADIVLLQESDKIGSDKDLSSHYRYHEFIKTGKSQSNRMDIFSKYQIVGLRDLGLDSQTNGAFICQVILDADTVCVINCHLESDNLSESELEKFKSSILDLRLDSMRVHLPAILRKVSDAAARRAPEARMIRDEALLQRRMGRKVLIGGDFNDTAQGYAHSQISGKFRDAFIKSGRGFGFSYVNGPLKVRIDHLLFSDGLTPIDCVIDSSIHSSDHFPVISSLSRKRK